MNKEDEDFVIDLDTKIMALIITVIIFLVFVVCGTIGYFVVRWLF